MKKLLFALLLFTASIASATPPILIRPNAATINVSGAIDTAITINRLLLVEYIRYDGTDSTINVTFTAYANTKELARRNTISTNVPLVIAPFKLPDGTNVTRLNILQYIKQYYEALGYLANPQ